MSTRDIVPRTNNEGGIGTIIKKWLNGYFSNIFATGGSLSGVEIVVGSGITLDITDANLVGPVTTSAGIEDAGKIPKLDSSGLLDTSFFSEDIGGTGTGFVPSTILASEDLSAGDFVNIYDDSGIKCRKAIAIGFDTECHGYVLTTVSGNQMVDVYFGGTNNQVTGLSMGKQYLSSINPGICTHTTVSGSGNIVQKVGFATSATSMDFNVFPSIRLA